jgi:Lrp/AsnC family leucine-responsive transcriptional regulator
MTYNFDLKDRKILYELDRNCRKSGNTIAKKVGLSKTAVVNRINNLEKQGIIKGYYAVIDNGKLGFFNFRVYINLQNTTLEKENEIIEFLQKKDIVTWISTMEGLYNLGLRIFTKNINEMNELWDELMHKYVNYFNQRLIVLNIRTLGFFRNYLLEKPKEVYEIISGPESLSNAKVKIDSNDEKIIEILSENAKASIVDISSKTKLTPKTIISKIKKLKENKIILYYRGIINSEITGYKHFKLSIMTANTIPKKLKSFYDYIKINPNIISREETLGGEDIELDLEVKDIIELRKIIEDIRKKFGDMIQDYNFHYIVKEHKNLFFNL